jgi:RNA polymerase sigma-70 factor (ECF subfamily)
MDTSANERLALLSAEVARHSGYLLRYARTRIRDEHRAEEAVQETLLAALEALPTYDGRATLRTWLTGVLIHKIHDLFRRNAREPELAGDELPEVVDPMTPEHRLHGRQLADAFVCAVGALPPRQADALVMREISGLEPEEICRRMGVTESNLWVLLHRARANVRAALERRGLALEPGLSG